jgi:hypothetical protein
MSKKFVDVNTVRKNFKRNISFINYPKEKLTALVILLALILFILLKCGGSEKPIEKNHSERFNKLINEHRFIEAEAFYDSLVNNKQNTGDISKDEVKRLKEVIEIIKQAN